MNIKEYEGAVGKLKNIKKDIEIESKRLVDYSETVNNLEKEVSDLQAEKVKLKSDLDALRSESKKVKDKIKSDKEKANNGLLIIKEQQNEVLKDIDAKKKDLEKERQEVAKIVEVNSKEAKRLDGVKIALQNDEKRNKVNEKALKLKEEKLKKDMDEVEPLRKELIGKIKKHEKEIKRLDRNSFLYNEKLSELNERQLALDKKEEEINRKRSELDSLDFDIKASANVLNKDLEFWGKENEKHEAQIEKINSKLKAIEQEQYNNKKILDEINKVEERVEFKMLEVNNIISEKRIEDRIEKFKK